MLTNLFSNWFIWFMY